MLIKFECRCVRSYVAQISGFDDFQGEEGHVIISFECRSCHARFDSEVGAVTFTPNPHFAVSPSCPRCGPRQNDQVWLTEAGQTQLTDAYLNS
jgi:hypothetical protein